MPSETVGGGLPLDTGQCVHCGLCLSACPTYVTTGVEAESPRGRVFLLQKLREKASWLNQNAIKTLDDCVDCRACEAVCPSHVATGHMIENWRQKSASSLESSGSESFRFFRKADRYLQFFFGSIRGLAWFQRLARFSQIPIIGTWMTHMPFFPKSARKLRGGLREAVPRTLSRTHKSHAGPESSTRVMLFVGCVMDTLYANTNHHAVDLLELGGVDVVIPQEQRCCGALHMHGGRPEVTKNWARANIQALEQSHAATLAVTAAGCGTMLKEYAGLFDVNDPWHQRAEQLAKAVVDITVLLAQLPLPAASSIHGTVSVHDPCHLVHAQGVRQEPRQILSRSGYVIQEMPESDLCCGAGGIYNLTHPEMADKLLKRKLAHIPDGIEWIAAANPGCLLQMESGLPDKDFNPHTAHPVDLVWNAYHTENLVGLQD